MSVPFVDLAAIHDPLREAMLSAIASVIDRDAYVLGAEVDAFEREIAAWLDVPHAIGVSSGTDALLSALMALDVGPGDEVVTTPFTFFATAGAIARLGATPVFADIEPRSFNLAPARVEAALSPRTKAIIAVHLFGRAADMDALSAIADRAGVALIEDAAQAIGAEWAGRRVGGLGRVGCFSFFPAKNLGCLGDGGLVTTADDALAARIRRLRTHGGEKRYLHNEVGGNFRLDALQAAVLRVKLPELEGWTAAREANARAYDAMLRQAIPAEALLPPDPGPGRHAWNQYVVRIPGGRRDAAREALSAEGIGSAVYYPLALHQQPCFQTGARTAGPMSEAERATAEVLALPIAPGLTPDGQEQVVATLARALAP
ncbi:MAG: DegT/DnrJ/EryC1/StrS family aminotransferase [Deltaproteobacteria bacterium]|nr:DegT/DnrJ/EryC1/StrS family aminotransferase [Deltaproteobacteria bacterium]